MRRSLSCRGQLRMFPATLLRFVFIGLPLALLFPSFELRAQPSREPAIAAPPAWVEPIGFSASGPAAEESFGRHYLLVESQTHVGEAASYRHHAYRVLSETALRHASQITVSFDPTYESLTFHHVRVRRADEVVDRLARTKIQVLQREGDLEELLYDGRLSAHVILDDIRVGDIIEVAYTRTGANPVFGGKYFEDFSLGFSLPVSHLRHRLIVPRGRALQHRIVGNSAIAAQETIRSEARELLWEGRDLPSILEEKKVPDWHNAFPFARVTEFTSWAEVAEWARPLYAAAVPPPDTVRQKADECIAGGGTTEEQVLRALRFVQEEIRYLGLEQGSGSHAPSAPEVVLRRRFGDCKDKARLFAALVRQIGHEAQPILVHSSSGPNLASWLPSPDAFDHVIVGVRIGEREFILDPTLLYQRGPLPLRHTTRYHAGLVIAGGTQALTKWKPSDTDIARTTVEETFTVAAIEAPAKFHVRSVFSGRAAERMRANLADENPEQLTRSYVDFYARYFPEVTAAQPVSWKDDPAKNTLAMDEHYTVPKLFTAKDGSTEHVADFYATALNSDTGSPGAGRRKMPFAVRHPVEIFARTRVDLPSEWPEEQGKLEVRDPTFVFTSETKSRGKTVEWSYTWRSLEDHVKPADFAAYRRNIDKVKDEILSQLTYDTAAPEEAPFRLNWMMAAGSVVMVCGLVWALRGTWGARRSDIPPKLTPAADGNASPSLRGLRGWLILVGIGLCLRPVWIIRHLVESGEGYFDRTAWNYVTSPGNPGYDAHYVYALPIELAFTLAALVLPLIGIRLFFGRRRAFPRVAIAMFALDVVSAANDAIFNSIMSDTTEAELRESYVLVAKTLVVAAIWIPYFCLSRRVKQTFVE